SWTRRSEREASGRESQAEPNSACVFSLLRPRLLQSEPICDKIVKKGAGRRAFCAECTSIPPCFCAAFRPAEIFFPISEKKFPRSIPFSDFSCTIEVRLPRPSRVDGRIAPIRQDKSVLF
ncbi:MAG: hypothetical protein IJS17_03100, partial [Clostridia bacterium]|nr:hypothetical protein [Clostridia bacterium]